MKRILSFGFMLFAMSSLYSQSQRTMMIEEFTQASCPPCETTTPALNTIIEANASKLVQIRYQTSWPGVDPMNADNPGEVQTRVDYYSVSGVPNLFVDGVDTDSPGTVTQAQLDAAYSKSAPVLVEVEHTLSADLATIDVTVKVTNEGTEMFDMGTDKLRVAIIEEDITWPTPPGSTSLVVFEAVMKSFLTTPIGMDMPAVAAGETWENSWTEFAMPGRVYDFNKIAVVAFIQNDTDKSVLQAGMSELQVLEGYADLGVAFGGDADNNLCNYGFVGQATIANSGSGSVDDYTVNLVINDEVVQSVQVTEELAGGATNVVDFEALNLQGGTSFISYNVVVAAGDIATLNNSTQVFTIGKASDAVANIEKTYESEVLGAIPAGAIIDRPFDRLNFIVVNQAGLEAANPIGGFGESENTMMINFWQWNPASTEPVGSITIGEQYVVEQSASVTFDYAYTSFQNSNDRLEVQVSTDCGESFTSIFNKSGAELRTAPELNTNDAFFKPSAGQWKNVDLGLDNYVGETVLIRFKVTSAWGDMLYIDNINVSSTVDVNELAAGESVEMYPNPVSEVLTIDLTLESSSDVQLKMIDMLGRTVKSEKIGNVSGSFMHSMDVSDVANGAYLIYLTVGEKAVVKRVNVTH
ncbi:MAG: Omp28-related outer membrane protein [Saprospiraceae bacterium]